MLDLKLALLLFYEGDAKRIEKNLIFLIKLRLYFRIISVCISNPKPKIIFNRNLFRKLSAQQKLHI